MSTAPSTTFVVLGSGSLARAVCYSLAVVAEEPTQVVVVARNTAGVEELCQVARVRSVLSGTSVDFRSTTVDLGRFEALADALARIGPDVVLLCASTQSPWERTVRPSGWTRFLAQAGFGVTLPLHVELALTAARATATACPDAVFVNAAFPDAVNPMLAELGMRVHAGVGNVAVLAAAIQTALGLANQDDLAVLAHHVHLHAPGEPGDDVLVWVADEPRPVGSLLTTQRAVDRHEANQVTGHTAALLLRDLVSSRSVSAHLPGPGGLPGGYPVRIGGRRVELRLPVGVTEDAAIGVNQRWAELDGVTIVAGRVRFSPPAAERLHTAAPGFPVEFAIEDIQEVLRQLVELRDRLRVSRPSG